MINAPIVGQEFLSFKDFLIPVFNWLQISILLHELALFSKEELQSIIKTTSKFSIEGNQASLERVCSTEVLLDFNVKEDDSLFNENNQYIYQRQHVSLFNVIQSWRKQ